MWLAWGIIHPLTLGRVEAMCAPFAIRVKMSIEIHVLIEALFALPEAAVGEV